MRARRLIAAASVAVGLVALAGCRTEPGVAAYVGDHRFTEDSVTSILDEMRDHPSASSAPQEQAGSLLPGRDQVVATLVLLDVCQRLSADKGYQPQTQLSAAQVAQQMGLPAEAVYPQRIAEFYTCLSGIPAGAPVTPTKEELADVVAAGRAAGAVPAEVSDEQAATQLDNEQLRSALASRKMLADAADGYDISVNPRYRPLMFPLLSFPAGNAAVSVPLGESGSSVADISTPETEDTASTAAVAP